MPSALEKLVKILKLERDTHYKNTAVIGGLQSFADNWQKNAHQQAKISEHHQLVDEIVGKLHEYETLAETDERHEAIKYMLGRIMGRIPAPPDLPPSSYVEPEPAEPPKPAEPPEPVHEPAQVSHKEPDASDDEDDDDNNLVEDDTVSGDELVLEDAIDDTTTTFDDDYEPDDYADDDRAYKPTPPVEQQPTFTYSRRRKPKSVSPEEAAQRFADLQAPITALHKVGEKMAEKLVRLGINTLEDMLFTFPRRYDDYTQLRTLNHLHPGETVTIVAAVRSIARRQGRGGQPYLSVMLDDETGSLQVFFFGQPWLQRQFRRGSQVVMSGEVELFRGELAMTNPEWEMMERENLHTNRIVPVYPLTKGIAARTMRRLMRQALNQWSNRIPDYVPESVLERADLPDLIWAIQQVHFPDSLDALAYARSRLSFDELFLFQMAMQANRRDWQAEPGQALAVADEWLDQFLGTLPYALTEAQQRALTGIRDDIARDVPMNRLLQGDVGSGKTVVATAALAIAVQNGKQAALMAPTSILAEQHARSVSKLLAESPGGENITVRLLTGNTSDAEREAIYAGLADGSVNVIIGTHAIIQSGVEFHDLALAVIDEQHRFGVQQRG
ncbi:MAG: DEAD/DEAH box helicase, partial [Anaerolineae bacterium]|nr:DEAD/DEAH box helicase [Anaerolineae bacterium]